MFDTTLQLRVAVWLGVIAVCVPALALDAAVIHVPDDFPTIQQAINAASNGDEVVIAPGTYGGCNNFNGKAITVRSTDPDDPDIVAATVLTGCEAIISGAVEFDSNEGPDSILRGLTIAATGETNGVFIDDASPTIDRCVFTGHNGGTNRGMQIQSSSAATITQCTFIDNHPHGSTFAGCGGPGGGGAILVCGGSGNGLLISDCTFTNNSIAVGGSTGGAIATGSGLVTMTGCTFTGNSAPAANGDGNGAVRAGGSTTVSDCTFINNSAPWGGAMASSGTVVDCHFTGNEAAIAGGALRMHGAGTAENCTFTMNSAPDGGALLARNDATVSMCSFTENTATNGGAISLEGNALVTNCIVEENTATGNGGGVWAGIGSGTVSNSLIRMNDAGGAGGGMYVGVDAMPTIADSVFCQNTPDQLTLDGLTMINGLVLTTDEPECAPMISEFGACCLPSGDCVVTTDSSCAAAEGVFQGDGASCESAKCPPGCTGDLTGDGDVNVFDLLALLSAWGTCP